MTCIKEFPHLVQMHNKYAAEGLAAISVSLDELSEDPKKVTDRVLHFLQARKANFTNLILDEPIDVWQQKLHMEGPPVVFVFDRDGKQVKQFKDEFSYDDVEKLVVTLLRKH